MNFEQILIKIKEGYKVTRRKWSLGAYVQIIPEAVVPLEWCKTEPLMTLAKESGVGVKCAASMRLITEDKVALTGWLPSMEDIFAEDWVLYLT